MANNINIDSKSLPQTARAWKAPAVLNVIAGWTFLSIMIIAGVNWIGETNQKAADFYKGYQHDYTLKQR